MSPVEQGIRPASGAVRRAMQWLEATRSHRDRLRDELETAEVAVGIAEKLLCDLLNASDAAADGGGK